MFLRKTAPVTAAPSKTLRRTQAVLSAGPGDFCFAGGTRRWKTAVAGSMSKKVKARQRLPLSRPPLERMLRIHQAIRSGSHPNATRLAVDLEVSTKSIHRDLEFMRDRLELPVEFDPKRNGYRYAQEVSSFPTLQITEGELFALLVAEKALQQYRGTTFEKPLLSAFRKMAASL